MSRTGDSASSDASAARLRRLRRAVVLSGALVILIYAGSSAYDAWRSYGYSLAATDRELANVAGALAEQTAWTLKTVDLLLADTVRWYRTDGQRYAPDRIDAILANRASGVPLVRQLMIADAAGNPLYRSRPGIGQIPSVADRSYFIAQRAGGGAGLYMSEPLITRSENRAAVIFSRRLEDDAGRFAGVLAASVDLEDLQPLYQAVNLGRGGTIALLRDDGTLLVSSPVRPDAIGHKFPALAAAPAGTVSRLTSPIDGRPDFLAVIPVRDTHLRLAVTREEGIALAPWRDETVRVGMRTLVLMLLGALTLGVLLRQLQRIAAGERALAESEERYALAMEGANEGHWDWDLASDRLFLSPKMKLLDGQRADSAIESRSAWLARIDIHPEDRPRFESAIRDHVQGRTPNFECEYRVRQPQGDWRWLLARGRCLIGAEGKPVRLVGSAIDVTAQKRAQLDKEQLEAQLRQSQKMEAIGTLAGGIAHDFNNILGAILGYGELAHQHGAADGALRRYLDNVMHAAERAKLLVERILGFSRSGLGDRSAVNVGCAVGETLELLEASLPAGIRLERRLQAGDAAVMGDATDLHQLAMNLCTNAIQAMEHGGVLSVSLERAELGASRRFLHGSLPPGPYVRLIVGDTGSGIAPEVLERIFDPFFTTKGVGAGTGLGLALVHGIVADLGGAIEVSTRAGEGTVFDIWLPVAGEAPPPAAAAAPDLPRGGGETVMIVDDEPALVALAEEIVARLGYEPVGLHSGGAALAALHAAPERFDLVLTDESMPELAGTALAQAMRRLRPDLPIILMTGRADAPLAARAAASAVNETLRKPLRQRELAEALARVLAMGR